MNNPV